jgi:hypothetical protein
VQTAGRWRPLWRPQPHSTAGSAPAGQAADRRHRTGLPAEGPIAPQALLGLLGTAGRGRRGRRHTASNVSGRSNATQQRRGATTPPPNTRILEACTRTGGIQRCDRGRGGRGGLMYAHPRLGRTAHWSSRGEQLPSRVRPRLLAGIWWWWWWGGGGMGVGWWWWWWRWWWWWWWWGWWWGGDGEGWGWGGGEGVRVGWSGVEECR